MAPLHLVKDAGEPARLPVQQPARTADAGHVYPEAMAPADMIRRLDVSPATFYRYQMLGQFRHLLLSRPCGIRRYSRALVEQWLQGQSTVAFGRGARHGRG